MMLYNYEMQNLNIEIFIFAARKLKLLMAKP